MNRFSGLTALVTGAASGIGAASARRLAAEGAAVTLVDVAEEAGHAVARGIRDDGGQATFVACDVSDPLQWVHVVDQVHEHFGMLDVLHCNAYAHVSGAPDAVTVAQWHRVLAVNLDGFFLAVRAFAGDLRVRRGAIVATSSVHSTFGIAGYSAYAASKGAINSLCRQLAVEYAPDVRVNCVVPGPVYSGAWDTADAHLIQRSSAATALGRLGQPEEVAAAVAFLASSEASFITGASLTVDGGWSVSKDSG